MENMEKSVEWHMDRYMGNIGWREDHTDIVLAYQEAAAGRDLFFQDLDRQKVAWETVCGPLERML